MKVDTQKRSAGRDVGLGAFRNKGDRHRAQVADPPQRGTRPPAAGSARTRSGRPPCRRSRRPAGAGRRRHWGTRARGSASGRGRPSPRDQRRPAAGRGGGFAARGRRPPGPRRGRRPGGGRRWRHSATGRARGARVWMPATSSSRRPRSRSSSSTIRSTLARRSKASGVRTTIPSARRGRHRGASPAGTPVPGRWRSRAGGSRRRRSGRRPGGRGRPWPGSVRRSGRRTPRCGASGSTGRPPGSSPRRVIGRSSSPASDRTDRATSIRNEPARTVEPASTVSPDRFRDAPPSPRTLRSSTIPPPSMTRPSAGTGSSDPDLDAVALTEPIDGDQDFAAVGRDQAAEAGQGEARVQEPPPLGRQLAAEPALPELEEPGHQGGGEELTVGQRRDHDDRIERRQAELPPLDLKPRRPERPEVEADQQDRAERHQGRNREVGQRRDRQVHVRDREPGLRRARPARPQPPNRSSASSTSRTIRAGGEDRGIVADQQARRPRAEGRAANARDPVQDALELPGQGVVPAEVLVAEAEPAGLVGRRPRRSTARPRWRKMVQVVSRIPRGNAGLDPVGGFVPQRGGKPPEEPAAGREGRPCAGSPRSPATDRARPSGLPRPGKPARGSARTGFPGRDRRSAHPAPRPHRRTT